MLETIGFAEILGKMKQRFTLDGSAALERRLDEFCQNTLQELRAVIPEGRLKGLLLGGGYGRGEGGVLRTSIGDAPYNDLEFWVCVRGPVLLNTRRFGKQLHWLGQWLSAQIGVDVEFKIFSEQQLASKPPSMFAYDLAAGHRRIFGSEQDLLPDGAVLDAANLPMSEATRLLFNRCSGLLFAEEKLRRNAFSADDADFVGRNHAKAQLALGDALLCAAGLYHWSCRERNARFQRAVEQSALGGIPGSALPVPITDVLCHHTLGVEFKLHPHKSIGAAEAFRSRQVELSSAAMSVWLWLEQRRLNSKFAGARDYAFSNENKCPETHPLKNWAINLRTFGPAGCLCRKCFRYPRERLFEALSLLLWDPEAVTNPLLLKRIQNNLDTKASSFGQLVHAYHTLWEKFN